MPRKQPTVREIAVAVSNEEAEAIEWLRDGRGRLGDAFIDWLIDWIVTPETGVIDTLPDDAVYRYLWDHMPPAVQEATREHYRTTRGTEVANAD